MFQRRTPILIFGAGTGAVRAHACLRHRCRVLAFVDNDPKKQGTRFLGRPVVQPDQLRGYASHKIYVASMYANEIYRQLTVGLAIDPARVVIVRREILEGAYDVSRWTYVAVGVIGISLLAAILAIARIL
jgi:hypothetical protein